MNIESISLSVELLNKMIFHVHICLPEEGCGLLAGLNGVVEAVLPVLNQAHSALRYYMDPVELLHALEWIEENQFDLLGIFHSHPNGPGNPSETDIREFNYPGVATIILNKSQSNWQARVFMIENGGWSEIRLIPNEKS